MARIKKQKQRSDILIEYFIAKNNYENFNQVGYQEQSFELMEADLTALKTAITDQIVLQVFEQVFGKSEYGVPVGIVNDKHISIFYLDFDSNKAFTKTVDKSDYYQYLSLCHKILESKDI